MTRNLTVGVAQLGPISRQETRSEVVCRLIDLLTRAHQKNCKFVVFPELALTTFFPRWFIENDAELDQFYETEMPNDETRPLFDKAAEFGIGFYLGYAELTEDENGKTRRFNTAWPPGSFQRIPDNFIRCVNTVLHAASVMPLPIGRCIAR